MSAALRCAETRLNTRLGYANLCRRVSVFNDASARTITNYNNTIYSTQRVSFRVDLITTGCSHSKDVKRGHSAPGVREFNLAIKHRCQLTWSVNSLTIELTDRTSSLSKYVSK